MTAIQGQPLTAKSIREVVRPKPAKVKADPTMDDFRRWIAKLEDFVERAGVSHDGIPLLRCLEQVVESKMPVRVNEIT